MPPLKVRADHAQLTSIAQNFDRQAASTRGTLDQLRRRVDVLKGGQWVGQNATKFYQEISSQVFPAVKRLVDALEQAARTTDRISQVMKQAEQDAAAVFRLDGGGGSPGGNGASSSAGPQGGSATGGQGASPGVAGGQPGPGGPGGSGSGIPPGGGDKNYWTQEALRAAGIDPAAWDPSKGFPANAETVKKVYAYYSQLYLNHPELQWAGMAKLAGGTVYGGLLEITAVRTAAEISGIVPPVPGLGPVARLAASDLQFLENKLVEMQKAIFMDLAWQHQAYAQGGIEAMRQLNASGQLSPAMLRAWEDIASGDPARVNRGNETLLMREQRDILTPYYNSIQSYGPLSIEGKAMSVAMSLMSESPVPGGQSFRDVVHTKILGVDTGLPGNITDFNDRWQWIKQDMLPRWQQMNATDLPNAQAWVNTDLETLALRNLAKQGESVVRFVVQNTPPGIPLPPVIP